LLRQPHKTSTSTDIDITTSPTHPRRNQDMSSRASMNMDKTISHLNGLLQERDQLILQKEQMEKEMQRQKSLTDLFMEGLKKTQKEVQTLTETVKTERQKI
jgi:hypothetical protein